MIAAALGSLLVRIKGVGILKTGKQLGAFQQKFDKMSKKMKPALQGLAKGWGKMGAVAGLMLWRLTNASPRLAAQMEILNMRTNMLMREFGDALAPAIEVVIDVVKEITDWFKGLPEPLQNAVTGGMAVAIMLGLLAGAFFILSAAASPVTLIILAIAAAAALLFLAFETNFLGIRDIVDAVFKVIEALIGGFIGMIEDVINTVAALPELFETIFGAVQAVLEGLFSNIGKIIENIIGIFEGIITFFTSIFSGDIEGALEAIADIFESVMNVIIGWIMLPVNALNDLIKALTGTDILKAIMDAGKAIIDAFIKGAQKAIEAAGQLLTDILEGIGSFLGGSLPEKGPLRHVDVMGFELGEAYVTNIGRGMGSPNISRTINRNFRINTVNVTAQETDFATSQKFGERLSTEVRKGTSW